MLEELVGILIGITFFATIIGATILICKLCDYIHDRKDDKMFAEFEKTYPALSASMKEYRRLHQATLDVWNDYYADIYGKMKAKRALLPTATNSEREQLSIEIDELQKICDEGKRKEDEMATQASIILEQNLNEVDKITDQKMVKFLNRKGWHK